MPLQRALLCGLVLLVVAAPLPFGAVQRGMSLRLAAAGLVLGLLWIAWRCRAGMTALPWKDPVLAGGALILLFGVVQAAPLPKPVLETVSPAAAGLRSSYEPSPIPGDAGARPISLDPASTRLATLKWLTYLVAALITLDLASHRKARNVLIGGLVAGGGLQAIYGLCEFLSGRQHIFGYAKKYYTDVATGTFINRNHFAGYLELTLPLTVAVAAAALARLRARPGVSTGERLANAPGRELFNAALLLLLALVMATALACSRSRMGIASTALALAATGIVLTWKGRGRGFAAAAVVVAGATILLFAQGGAGVPILDRFAIAVTEFQGSLGRREMWGETLRMAAAFPLFGSGLGSFGAVFPVFRTAGAGVALTHAHNDYLEWVAEAGLVGVLVLLAATALVTAPLLTRRGGGRPDLGTYGYAAVAGLVAIGLHSLTDFNLEIPANALTLAVVAALALAWRRAPTPVPATDAVAAPRPGWVMRAAPAAALLAALGLAIAPIGDDPEKTFRTAARLERGVLDDLQALGQAEAGGAPPSRVAVEYIGKRLETARNLQDRGLARLPISATGHLGMGRLDLVECAAASMSGRPPGLCATSAMREFRAATSLVPMNAVLHAQVARILLRAWPLFGETERAYGRAIVDRAILLNPADRDLAGAGVAVAAVTEG